MVVAHIAEGLLRLEGVSSFKAFRQGDIGNKTRLPPMQRTDAQNATHTTDCCTSAASRES